MRRIFVVVAGLMLCSQSASAFDQQNLLKVFFSVVLVRGYDNDGGLAYGTGVVVAENKVATNCHVLRKTGQAWVSQAEEVYKIESVQADTRHDLCLLTTEKLPLIPVTMGSTSALAKGEESYSLGHSSGAFTPQTSAGQIKSLYPFEHGNVVRTSARFTLGASGSPLFDAQGKLIGINTFKTPGRAAYFYAVPVEWIAEVAKLPPQTQLPISGQAFWELPDAQKPYFMQVALPHLNDDWPRLLEISQRWLEAEPQNAEAWYESGAAEEGMGQMEQAQQSYRQAIALNPKHTEALFRVGVFAAKRGDRQEVRDVGTTLAALDGEAAAEYRKTVGCSAEC